MDTETRNAVMESLRRNGAEPGTYRIVTGAGGAELVGIVEEWEITSDYRVERSTPVHGYGPDTNSAVEALAEDGWMLCCALGSGWTTIGITDVAGCSVIG
jgi:hypothetical protein